MHKKSFEDGREFQRIAGEISSYANEVIRYPEKYNGKGLQITHLLLRNYLAKLEELRGQYYPKGDSLSGATCDAAKLAIEGLEARLKEQGLNSLKVDENRGIVEDKEKKAL